MSEKDKKIIEAVAEALPNMTEFEKGYMLGVAESNSKNKEDQISETEQKGA